MSSNNWGGPVSGRRRGRTRTGVIAAVLALLVGAAFIAYPFVSDAVNQMRERSVIEATVKEVRNTDEATLEAERERAYEYNKRLLDGRAVVTDPFDPDAERPNDEDYNEALNLSGDGVMAPSTFPRFSSSCPYTTPPTNRSSPTALATSREHRCLSGETPPIACSPAIPASLP